MGITLDGTGPILRSNSSSYNDYLKQKYYGGGGRGSAGSGASQQAAPTPSADIYGPATEKGIKSSMSYRFDRAMTLYDQDNEVRKQQEYKFGSKYSDEMAYVMMIAGGTATADGVAPVGDIVGGSILITAAAIILIADIYDAIQEDRRRSAVSIPDVKAKVPKGDHPVYTLAYIHPETDMLIRTYIKFNYPQAMVALRAQSLANQVQSEYGAGQWGIYAHDQRSAKALAASFGAIGPEVHGYGYYGHYHSANQTMHVWFGGPILF